METGQNINWKSTESHVFLNPKLSHDDALYFESLHRVAPEFNSQLWLSSSGTLGKKRLVALSKQAFLTAAASVNEHLSVHAADRWGVCLPLFHVAGLSILARAHLCENECFHFDMKWDASEFVQFCSKYQITLTSMVPTQIFDLVQQQVKCPEHLRAVFVGGQALSSSLYFEARKLGWPLLPCYGMTETCAMVAAATLESLEQHDFPRLKTLQHIDVQTDAENRFMFKSPSLLTGFMYFEQRIPCFTDPKIDDWFLSDDYGEVVDDTLTIFGRESDYVKIGAEAFFLSELQAKLDETKLELGINDDVVLLTVPNKRLGKTVALVSKAFPKAHQLIELYNSKVLPNACVREHFIVKEIPYNDLGKVNLSSLLMQIS